MRDYSKIKITENTDKPLYNGHGQEQSGHDKADLLRRDPRPELINDSELWTRLLNLALEQDRMFAGALHGMRCGGTRIKVRKDGQGYALRPEVGPHAWDSVLTYEYFRDKYLKLYREVLIEVLKKL